jgi:trk system potassium uptake protein TrkH
MSRDFKLLFKSLEVRAMALLIGIVTLLLLWDGVPLLDAFFNVISGITTTGFVSGDISSYNDFSKYMLVLLLNIGGGYGSTSSGIKIIRFLILIKAVEWYIRKITSPPRVIIPFKIQNKVFTTLLYTVLHFFFLAGGIMIFMLLGNTLMDSLFMISSAQGNNGLVTLTQYTDPEKLIMMFHMWIGRLEIIPVLVLLTLFKRKS